MFDMQMSQGSRVLGQDFTNAIKYEFQGFPGQREKIRVPKNLESIHVQLKPRLIYRDHLGTPRSPQGRVEWKSQGLGILSPPCVDHPVSQQIAI